MSTTTSPAAILKLLSAVRAYTEEPGHCPPDIYTEGGEHIASMVSHDPSHAALFIAAPELLAVAEMVKPHGEKLREKSKWLQTWLHESPEGKALPEIVRASFGQLIAEMNQLATGSKLPQAARAAILKATATSV